MLYNFVDTTSPEPHPVILAVADFRCLRLIGLVVLGKAVISLDTLSSLA